MTSKGGLSIELKDSGKRNDRISKCMTCALTIGRVVSHGPGQEFTFYDWVFTLPRYVHLVPVNHQGFDVDDNFGYRHQQCKASSLPTVTNTSVYLDRPKYLVNQWFDKPLN